MLVLIVGSLLNILVIWWARRLAVVVLWLGYTAVLGLAFVRPALLTQGIEYPRGHLTPGAALAGLLAILAIEASLLAVLRLDGHGRDEVAGAMKTAIACFSSFVVACILAIAVMANRQTGMN